MRRGDAFLIVVSAVNLASIVINVQRVNWPAVWHAIQGII